MKIFRNGEDSGSYDGPRTADGMVHYMKKRAGPNSVFLKTEKDLEVFINHSEPSIIGIFPGSNSAVLAEYLKVAALLRDQFRLAHSTDPSVGRKYGVHSQGVVLQRPPRLSSRFEENFVFSEILKTTEIPRFIREQLHGLCPHLTLENRDRLRVRDLMTVHYDLDYQLNPRGSAYWRNRVMRVVSQYASRGLSFAVANQKDFLSELEADFGLGVADGAEFPVVTIRTKLGYKYTMREEFTRDGKSLQRFLEDYFAGRLKPFIKSQPIPENNNAPVKVVVAESFQQIVLRPDVDVLIQFHSESCSHCKRLQPLYTALAHKLSSDPHILVTKMDAAANDVPVGFHVQGFPTFYFVPAGGKDQPIRYEGGRELNDFLQFLRRESTHQLQTRDEL